ncbi:MAG: helix-turn-helix transcriptional regulator [Phycisphaerales bacterium]
MVTKPFSNPQVRTLSLGLRAGCDIPSHGHDWHQLIYASEGVMTVTTEEGVWVVPPERAVWVSASITHSIRASSFVRMRTLYVRPDVSPGASDRCCVVNVSGLLRQLILRVCTIGTLGGDDPLDVNLIGLLLHELRDSGRLSLELPIPRDPRARVVADRVIAGAKNDESLQQLAEGSGASARTIQRLFSEELRMTFRRWRQQAILLEALRLLAAGDSVDSVAEKVGYSSTSAFIAMFKKTLGTTPHRYYDDIEQQAWSPHS